MSERQNQSFYSAYGNITVLDVVTICSAAKLPRKKVISHITTKIYSQYTFLVAKAKIISEARHTFCQLWLYTLRERFQSGKNS